MQFVTRKSHFKNLLAKKANQILDSGYQIINFSVVHCGSYYVGFFEIAHQ